MTVIEYVSILEKESQELSALSDKLSDIELLNRFASAVLSSFWELCNQYGLDFVIELKS